jgi:hypothetical protein
MERESVKVELLVNPFCFEEVHLCEVRKICAELGVPLAVYNPWDIDDEELGEIPGHIATFLSQLRSGQRPGSVYSNLFINSERVHLNFEDWPEKVREMIAKAIKEESDD